MNNPNKINKKIIFIGILLFSNVSQADYKFLFNNAQSKGLIPEKTESVFSSCKEVLEQNPDAPSGVYTINIQNEALDLTLPIAKARGFCSVPVFSNLDRFGFKLLSEVRIMDEVLLSRLL